MNTTFIELGDAQMTFVNASQVTMISATATAEFIGGPVGRPRVEISTAESKRLPFHGDQIEGAAAQQVLVELLAEIGKPQREARTRIITYLNGSVQSRYL